jgi:hypothetical protein
MGRFFSAAFLGFWLAGWTVGEGFAFWMLGRGARSLLTGEPLGAGHKSLGLEAALPVGLFLLFWLTLWTLGGVMAGRELLRLLFGRDRILMGHDTIEIEHSFGLFRWRDTLKRADLRRFYRRPGSVALCVETARGTTELTRLGTPAERAELERTLNAEFHLAAQPAPAGTLPRGWCEVLSLERDPVLVKDPAVRQKQAWTIWIVCVFLALIPLYLLSAARQRPDLLAPVIFFVALAAAAGWEAIWLSFGRNEWRLDKGRLVLQRRFGQNRTPRFEAASLELVEDNSGDNGSSYLLTAVAAGAPARTRSHSVGQHRRTIHSQSDDPTGPRNFGLWLSQRCRLPFADLTTADAKAKELEALKQQLANSGRLGRVALRIVEGLVPARRPPDA